MTVSIPIWAPNATADTIAQTVVLQMPFLPGMFLFILYIVIAGGGYLLQEKRQGEGDIKAWLAISGFVCSVIAIFLFFVTGLLDPYTLLITFGVTAAAIMAWFLS